MDYTTVIFKIITPIIILCFLVYFLFPLYFLCQRKKFIVWAEEQYAVLISNNSDKASLILTILSNDIKIDKLSGLLDNEKVFDINSGKEENIIDIFNRPYSMPKYLFLRDESANHKKEVKGLIISEYYRYLEDLENRPKTPLFLVTSYKGTLWKEIKLATEIPFIKVLGLKKFWWKKDYYYLKIIIWTEDKHNPHNKEIIDRFSILVRPNDITTWKKHLRESEIVKSKEKQS